jgi:NAD-dependent DNA ligase
MSDDDDEHGQPRSRSIHGKANLKKAINVLGGMCRGILADGVVTEGEARAFRQQVWDMEMKAVEAGNEKAWPIPQLVEAVDKAFPNNRIDVKGLEDLKKLMGLLIGDGAMGFVTHATALPLCDPAPDVYFMGRVFLITGKFSYGTRKDVEGAICSRGGKIAPSKHPSSVTDYLLIGGEASRDWKLETYGRKIEEAVAARDEKKWKIHIISEKHWERFL